MPIPIVCTTCCSKLKAPDGAAGKELNCPRCGTRLLVAASSSNVPATPPSSARTGRSKASQPLEQPSVGESKRSGSERIVEKVDHEPGDELPPKGFDVERTEGPRLIPYRNRSALVAYYSGVLSLIPGLAFLLGPLAIAMGIRGRRVAWYDPNVKGTVHAGIGIVLGALTVTANVAALLVLFVFGGWNKITTIEWDTSADKQVSGHKSQALPKVRTLSSVLPSDPALFYPLQKPARPGSLFLRSRDLFNPGRQPAASADPAVVAIVHVGEKAINDLEFSRDGRKLALLGQDGGIIDVQSSECLVTRPGFELLAMSPDGKWLVALWNKSVAAVYETATGLPNLKVELHRMPSSVGPSPALACSPAFSPDEKWLACTLDGKLSIWDTDRWEEHPVMKQDYWIDSITFAPNSLTLALAEKKDRTSVCEGLSFVGRGGETAGAWRFSGGFFSINYFAYSRDGNTHAAAGIQRVGGVQQDSHVIFCQPGRALMGHTGLIGKVAFSLDGKVLASKARDSTLRVWDVISGKQLVVREDEDPATPKALTISPDGRLVVTGGKGFLVARELAKLLRQ